MTSQRVLYVNWVDYLDGDRRGGGVTLYQRNLMETRLGEDATFIASGTSYDLRPNGPRLERIRHGSKTDRARRFEIVNSGVMAPSHFSFGDEAQLDHAATRDLFFDFLQAQGPFDIVHFNNLEGLPADVLTLRDRFPETMVILTLHNYYPFCPQVNLWHQEARHCSDFKRGAACVTCLEQRPPAAALRVAAGLSYRLKTAGFEPGDRGYDWTLRVAMGLARRVLHLRARVGRRRVAQLSTKDGPENITKIGTAQGFAHRRARMAQLINDHCNHVLCVSDAVRRIALAQGVRADLAQTCYIGTAQAQMWGTTQPRLQPDLVDRPLKLAYLGYMRRDKGFFFMLDALERAPADLLRRIHLVVAARRVSSAVQARLDTLRGRLAALDWHNGYRHDQLDDILAGVDAGLVPVLWEDCLPQVAIELHSRHIPLICSDMGGTRELTGTSDMVFPAGNMEAFVAVLNRFASGQIDLAAYWRAAMAPITMQQHLEQLEVIYRS